MSKGSWSKLLMEGCGAPRRYHLTFEFWYGTETALPRWLSDLGDYAPESLGSNLMQAGPKTMPRVCNCVNHMKIIKKNMTVSIIECYISISDLLAFDNDFHMTKHKFGFDVKESTTLWLSPDLDSQAWDTPAKRACIFFALQSQELLKIAVPCLQMLPKRREKVRNINK